MSWSVSLLLLHLIPFFFSHMKASPSLDETLDETIDDTLDETLDEADDTY